MRVFKPVLLAALLSLATPAAFAVPFAPGEIKPVPSLNFPGLVIADPLRPFTIDFGGGLTLSGDVQDRIVDYGGGQLSFETYIRNLVAPAGSSFSIESFARGSFAGYAVDATWDPTGLGTATPSLGMRSFDGADMTVFYGTGFPIPPTSGNEFVSFRTNATQFAATGLMSIGARGPNGQFASTMLTVYQPVPEPGVYAMMLAGALALLAVGRRRIPRSR
jgi:hypothetical protein